MGQFNLKRFSLEFRKSRRVVIVGASGSGKTYFGSQLTLKITNHAHIPVLIVDTKKELKFSKTKILDKEWVNSEKPLKRRICELEIDGMKYRDYHVSEFAAAVVWAKKSSVLYIEEIVEHVPKNSVNFPQSNPILYKLLQQGRERDCSLICATQRVAQLNLSFVDEATDLFIFRVGSREQKFIEDSFRLPQNSIDFNGKTDFGFYYIKSGFDPVWYEPIPYTRTSEILSPEQEIIEPEE